MGGIFQVVQKLTFMPITYENFIAIITTIHHLVKNKLPGTILTYLELMINYGFLRREVPGIGNNKKGIYLIQDAFFDTWFNFVYRNKNQIEQGEIHLDKGTLNPFLGKRFEKFIRDHLYIFFKDFRVGRRWWYKDVEIDILCTDPKPGSKEILFGECKWKDDVRVRSILGQLQEKVPFVKWHNEERKETFAVFARSFREKITQWQGHEVHCFDLQDIEALTTKNTKPGRE
jgi:AAA+ ATPase superfamily predicted ATPase